MTVPFPFFFFPFLVGGVCGYLTSIFFLSLLVLINCNKLFPNSPLIKKKPPPVSLHTLFLAELNCVVAFCFCFFFGCRMSLPVVPWFVGGFVAFVERVEMTRCFEGGFLGVCEGRMWGILWDVEGRGWDVV